MKSTSIYVLPCIVKVSVYVISKILHLDFAEQYYILNGELCHCFVPTLISVCHMMGYKDFTRSEYTVAFL